jgi:hypothetical protein
MSTHRRGLKGQPQSKACRDCRAPLLLVRDAEDPGHTHVLNAEQREGGTIIVIDGRGHEVPPGRGLGYTRHACGTAPAGGGSPDPEEVF